MSRQVHRLRRCRSTISHLLRTRTICGPRAIGHGAPRDTTGFRVAGSRHRMRARFGHRDTGDMWAGTIVSTTGSGDCTSGFMAELTTGMDTPAMDTTVATGTAAT